MSIWSSRFDLVLLSYYASRVVLVFAVGLLGWQIGSMISYSLESLNTLNSQPVQTNQQPSSSPSSMGSSSRIASIDLFGRQATVQELDKKNQVENVSETQLNLTVVGIVDLPNEKGVAIIQTGSQSLVVSVGEKIQSGVFLEEVYSDYVVIEHRGVLEKLVMSDSNELLDSNAFGLEDALGETSDVFKLRQELQKTPMKIMQYVRFQLMNAGSRDAMLKLWPKKDAELFKAFGLEAGDVLKNVNGQPVSELMKKPILWKKVLNESVLEMEVHRQDRVEFLVIDLTE